MNILSDLSAERGVLAGLIKYGSMVYHEVSTLDLIDTSFTTDSNKTIFKCLLKIFKENENVNPDIPLIYSTAGDLGLKYWFQKDIEVQYLSSLFELPPKQDNVLVLARKVKKLEIVRRVVERLDSAKNDAMQLTGNESINEIFGI